MGDDGPATGAHPVAADLLGGAADLLPAVASRPPVLACDLHTALIESAARLAGSADRFAHLRAASCALDQFASFLVTAGHTAPAPRTSQTLRGWLAGRDLGAVRQALATAADHCRHRGVSL